MASSCTCCEADTAGVLCFVARRCIGCQHPKDSHRGPMATVGMMMVPLDVADTGMVDPGGRATAPGAWPTTKESTWKIVTNRLKRSSQLRS